MNNLVQQVIVETGIDQEQAVTAVQTVVGHIKDQLPPSIADQLDGWLSAEALSQVLGQTPGSVSAETMQGVFDCFGSLFGTRR